MKHSVDTSVLVAAFASWHEHHDVAFAALDRLDMIIAHCMLETYSVLTRLPAPHRIRPDVVAQYFDETFAAHSVAALAGDEQRELLAGCITLGVTGGAIYDALIAGTCARAGLKLLTLDARARQTYAALGVAHEMLV